PCIVTPRTTRRPIAPTLRSGRPPDNSEPSAGSQTPLRPGTRIVSTPSSAHTSMSNCSTRRTYATTSTRSPSRAPGRVRIGELTRTVPGDLATAVDIDHRRTVGRPVGRSRTLAGRVDAGVLEQQDGVRFGAGEHQVMDASLLVPRREVVDRAEPARSHGRIGA